MNFIARSVLSTEIGSVNIAFRIFSVERWAFGGIHWYSTPLD
jgi:hypothetical protein